MISSVLFGLLLYSLPALVLGLKHPEAVGFNGWPSSRAGVIGFATLLFFGGLVGGVLTRPVAGGDSAEAGSMTFLTFSLASTVAIVRFLRATAPAAPTQAAPRPVLSWEASQELVHAGDRVVSLREAATAAAAAGLPGLAVSLRRVAASAEAIIRDALQGGVRHETARKAMSHPLDAVLFLAKDL
ncbi:MAG: hypothetical protein HQL37_07475, partial [Alphaproteobacteria bacterium]|nr:hypothetical protein [Alphaproteobacteria bacterium]